MSRRLLARLAAAGLIALLAAGVFARPAGAQVDLQLWPGAQVVTPGSEFEIQFRVTNASLPFNAFHIIASFDPAALTPVKLPSKNDQIGSLITTTCPASQCVNWFHMGAGGDTIDVSMLCPDSSTSGPGTVYRVHFVASVVPQVTVVRVLPDVQFVNKGVLLSDIEVTGGVVGIGMTPTLGAGDVPAGARLALTAWPNPARGDVRLDFGRPLGAGGVLAVHDVQGRLLRRLAVAPGARAGTWDGCDESGRRVPPGQYVVALRAGGTVRTAHVAQVR